MKQKILLIILSTLIILSGCNNDEIPPGQRLDQTQASDSKTMIQLALSGYAFDPLQGEPEVPPSLEKAVFKPGEPRLYLVQLTEFGPSIKGWKEKLRTNGVEFLDFTEENTYLILSLPEAVEEILEQEIVRAIVEYRPAYKVSKEILSQWEVYRGEEDGAVETCLIGQGKYFVVRVKDPDDREKVEEVIEKNGGLLRDDKGSQIPLINIQAEPQIVSKIAVLPEVLGIKVIENVGSAMGDNISKWDSG